MSRRARFQVPPETSSGEEYEKAEPKSISTISEANHPNFELSNTKSVIETTLLKSAGILSDFTSKALSESSSIFDEILAPDKFAFKFSPSETKSEPPQLRSRPVILSRRSRTLTETLRLSKSDYSRVRGKRKPNLANLPQGIIDILRADSNSSLTALNTPKKYHYHSKKMALKQRNTEGIKEKMPSQGETSKERIQKTEGVSKIQVVSTPLNLHRDDESSISTQLSIKDNDTNENVPRMPSRFYNHLRDLNSEKGTISSIVVKQSIRLNIGVEKGIPFVLGPKTKAPYFNTFAEENLIKDEEPIPGRKWVVNVGNFSDEEISLTITGKGKLKITGFRQPSLEYPEGQVVSTNLDFPTSLDIHNLVFYRAKDARTFLVIQEQIRNGNTLSNDLTSKLMVTNPV